MIDAGKLRHRITIQSPTETQDQTTGAISQTWENIADVWCAIEPLSVREFIAADAEDSKVNCKVIIRYRDGINAKMRLYHQAKNIYYNIEGILFDKDSGLEYITMPCSEGLRY